jgi:hypothetical protein
MGRGGLSGFGIWDFGFVPPAVRGTRASRGPTEGGHRPRVGTNRTLVAGNYAVPDAPREEKLTPALRQLQMIVGSLVTGCTIFLVIALFVSAGRGAAGGPPLVSYIATACGVMALLTRALIPPKIIGTGRQKILCQEGRAAGRGDALDGPSIVGRLLQLFATSTIVPCAVIEGATFFLLVAYVIEGWPPAVMAAVALIAVLALHMPTRSRAIHWIEDQLVLLEQERQPGK